MGVLCNAVLAWEVERIVDREFKYKLSSNETFHTSVGDIKAYGQLKITKKFFRQGYLTKHSLQKKLHVGVLQEATKLREVVYKHVQRVNSVDRFRSGRTGRSQRILYREKARQLSS